jgi:MoxR-like ATPase
MIFNQKTGEFEAKPGPLAAHVVLVDELNRFRSNVQAALNEAGSEGQITLGDHTIYLPKGFFMIGTQNPNAYGEGTNNQASSVVDRFGMSTFTDMPTADERYEAMLNRSTNSSSKEVPARVLDMTQLPVYQDAIKELVEFNPGVIRVGANVLDKILTDVQRDSKGKMTNPEYAKAPGFRAGDAIVDLARAKAAMAGKEEVDMGMLTAENGLLYSVLRHRVIIDGDSQGKLNEMISDAVKVNSTVLSNAEAAAKLEAAAELALPKTS